MITAVMLSMFAAMLSILAFCLARWPIGWMKLWSPQREYLAREYLSAPERRFLLSIRFRATMAGITLLAIAILLPVLCATSFHLPSRAMGDAPPPTILPSK